MKERQLVTLAGVRVCWVQNFTVFYTILRHFTVLYRILQYFTQFYGILQYYREFYSILRDATTENVTYTNLYVVCLEETKYRSNSGKRGFFFVVS